MAQPLVNKGTMRIRISVRILVWMNGNKPVMEFGLNFAEAAEVKLLVENFADFLKLRNVLKGFMLT